MIKVNDKVRVNDDYVGFDRDMLGVIGKVGVVVGIRRRSAIIKFEDYTDGYCGETYYEPNGIPYDPDDRSHNWVLFKYLIKVK